MPKKQRQQLEPIEAVKRLLILGLIKQGVQSKDIANVLGTDPSVITQMVPSRKVAEKS
jgi:hypothetical protein